MTCILHIHAIIKVMTDIERKSRETVSRELHRLQSEGKITVNYKKILILDLAALEKEVA